MAQAKTDNSTPAPIDSTRRRFLTVSAAASVVSVGALAAAAMPAPQACPIGLVAADDPAARIAHHQAELEKAWRDYYGPATVRTYADVRSAGATYTSHGKQWAALSSFMICSSEGDGADFVLRGHAWKVQQPSA